MKLVVVGGGITGLAAAHRAVELARQRSLALDLTLIEARDRLGGTIATERADGFLIEAGPDSFLSEKPWALGICYRLGLEGRLVRTDDRFRKVFVWRGGRLHPLPDGFQLLAPTKLGPFLSSSLFSWSGKLRMALDLVRPRALVDDESLGAFVRRRLGAQALERVAQPLVAGIYTADPDDLSLAATMPRFRELERRDRSVILGLWRAARRAPLDGTSGARWSLFVTFQNGMEELVTTLASRLPPGATRAAGLPLLERQVPGPCARGARAPPMLRRRRVERGRARAGRRDAGGPRARGAAAGARCHRRARAHPRLALGQGDAAVPRGPRRARRSDRAVRGRAPGPASGRRRLSGRRHRRLHQVGRSGGRAGAGRRVGGVRPVRSRRVPVAPRSDRASSPAPP